MFTFLYQLCRISSCTYQETVVPTYRQGTYVNPVYYSQSHGGLCTNVSALCFSPFYRLQLRTGKAILALAPLLPIGWGWSQVTLATRLLVSRLRLLWSKGKAWVIFIRQYESSLRCCSFLLWHFIYQLLEYLQLGKVKRRFDYLSKLQRVTSPGWNS